MSEWISVDERLPENNENVLIAHAYEFSEWDITVGWFGGKSWGLNCDLIEVQAGWNGGIAVLANPVTHWRPLI